MSIKIITEAEQPMQSDIAELLQENTLLRARNERLEAEKAVQQETISDKDFERNWMNYQKGFSDGVLAGIKQMEQALTLPEQRTWVGLTEKERDTVFELHYTILGGLEYGGDYVIYDRHFENAVAAIEAKLKEKNA